MRKIRSDKGKIRERRKPETKPMRVPIKFLERVKEFINNLLKNEKN